MFHNIHYRKITFFKYILVEPEVIINVFDHNCLSFRAFIKYDIPFFIRNREKSQIKHGTYFSESAVIRKTIFFISQLNNVVPYKLLLYLQWFQLNYISVHNLQNPSGRN